MEETVVNTQVVETPPAAALPEETAEARYARLYGQATPVQPAALQEMTQTLQSVRAEIEALRAAQAQPTLNPEQELEWVTRIQKGDYKGAQAAMRDAVKRELEPTLQALREESYSKALSAAQLSAEVDRINAQARSTNPDILPFERFLQAPVNERVMNARAAGRIQNTTDFLREYRSAVDAEVTALRNAALQLRAAGKDEATSRITDVRHSTTLTPQQVQSTQTQQSGATDQQGESTDDYFARRAAEAQRRRGM